VYVEQSIGISTDEFMRAKDSGVRYLRNVFPLIDLGWDRARCVEYLAERGFGHTVNPPASCPFHGNTGWRWIRDNDPDGAPGEVWVWSPVWAHPPIVSVAEFVAAHRRTRLATALPVTDAPVAGLSDRRAA
jgi:hypothetical protein